MKSPSCESSYCSRKSLGTVRHLNQCWLKGITSCGVNGFYWVNKSLHKTQSIIWHFHSIEVWEMTRHFPTAKRLLQYVSINNITSDGEISQSLGPTILGVNTLISLSNLSSDAAAIEIHELSSIPDKTSYCKISSSLEAARFVFRIVRSLWNLADTSAALLPKCLSNFKAMLWYELQISRLRDFSRSYDNTPYRILKRSPGFCGILG